jgi:hypothetical protein
MSQVLSSPSTMTMVVVCCAFSTLAPVSVHLAAEDSGTPAEESDERESHEKKEIEKADPRERRQRYSCSSKATLPGFVTASATVSGHRSTVAVHVGHSLANGLIAPLLC